MPRSWKKMVVNNNKTRIKKDTEEPIILVGKNKQDISFANSYIHNSYYKNKIFLRNMGQQIPIPKTI